ncbi:MAG: hypothetical protein HZA78_06380 [Candidatus Schekmanbacteria bacterium]|nr:hypothetical protein [Candidatus Schekmanbacteria bacterium]
MRKVSVFYISRFPGIFPVGLPSNAVDLRNCHCEAVLSPKQSQTHDTRDCFAPLAMTDYGKPFPLFLKSTTLELPRGNMLSSRSLKNITLGLILGVSAGTGIFSYLAINKAQNDLIVKKQQAYSAMEIIADMLIKYQYIKPYGQYIEEKWNNPEYNFILLDEIISQAKELENYLPLDEQKNAQELTRLTRNLKKFCHRSSTPSTLSFREFINKNEMKAYNVLLALENAINRRIALAETKSIQLERKEGRIIMAFIFCLAGLCAKLIISHPSSGNKQLTEKDKENYLASILIGIKEKHQNHPYLSPISALNVNNRLEVGNDPIYPVNAFPQGILNFAKFSHDYFSRKNHYVQKENKQIKYIDNELNRYYEDINQPLRPG